MKKFVRGIGLLELMLVLAILAIMMIVAVRYYSNANSAQEASTTVNSFNTIKSAVENYLADNPTSSTISSLNMATLVKGGYLPSTYAASITQTSPEGKPSTTTAYVNTWGGNITVSITNTGSNFTVTQGSIPQAVCNMAQGQLNASVNTNLGESVLVNKDNTCSSASNQITVTYVQ